MNGKKKYQVGDLVELRIQGIPIIALIGEFRNDPCGVRCDVWIKKCVDQHWVGRKLTVDPSVFIEHDTGASQERLQEVVGDEPSDSDEQERIALIYLFTAEPKDLTFGELCGRKPDYTMFGTLSRIRRDVVSAVSQRDIKDCYIVIASGERMIILKRTLVETIEEL